MFAQLRKFNLAAQIGTILGAAVPLLFIPVAFGIRLVLALYVIELILYLLIPWEIDHRNISKSQVTQRDVRWSRLGHAIVLVVWLSTFLFWLGGGLAVRFLPQAADDLILAHFTDATKDIRVAHAVAKVPIPSGVITNRDKSTTGVVIDETFQLLPTEDIGTAILAPASDRLRDYGGLVGIFVLPLMIWVIWFVEKVPKVDLG